MILQRLTTALRKQEWFTVVIETLIVMFGVFLGLQVNNWNQARFERADTQNVLERLERDFEVQLTLTNRGIGQQALVLEAHSFGSFNIIELRESSTLPPVWRAA